MQRQLDPGPLLDEQGRLTQHGYARTLCKTYDRRAIRAPWWRIKEWDYYLIGDGEHALALTIADNGYMGLDSISTLDFTTGVDRTVSPMRLFPCGRTGLPATSERGDVAVAGKGYSLRFDNDGCTRHLRAEMADFGGVPLSADITLTDAPQESMTIATPFAGKPRAFYYNQKINCQRAEGYCRVGGTTWRFDPATATAVLDWGRGVWVWQSTWYWSSLSGYVDGLPFGLNLGYGFGDVSAASENMIFVDGAAHKLGRVVFDIPKTAQGRDDFLATWRIHDDEGRVALTMEPILDRASKMDFGVLGSDQHQVFGRFYGTVRLDGGETVTLDGLVGFAEKVHNKW